MRTVGLLTRLGLWRVTRNPLARRVYDRLAAAGLCVARLDRFVRDGTIRADEVDATPAVDEVRVRRARNGLPDGLEDDPVAPRDLVVTGVREGRVIGYCCLSDRPVYVSELRRRLAFPGAYLWRVYVEPHERGRGVGKTLVGTAVHVAVTTLGVETVTALVAPDNVPSRRAFAALDFMPREQFTTVGFGDRLWTRGDPTR